MERKKLKDLTWKEMDHCGEIEKIAYRGDTKWMQYDEECGFYKNRPKNPHAFNNMEMIFSDKWLIMLLEDSETIYLVDLARADIGENQEADKKEYRDCLQELISQGKEIMLLAKSDASYYSFVQMAANGEIEMKVDEIGLEGLLHDIQFVKADGKTDLTVQKEEYTKKLNELNKNKQEHKAKKKAQLERYMALNGLESRNSGFNR